MQIKLKIMKQANKKKSWTLIDGALLVGNLNLIPKLSKLYQSSATRHLRSWSSLVTYRVSIVFLQQSQVLRSGTIIWCALTTSSSSAAAKNAIKTPNNLPTTSLRKLTLRMLNSVKRTNIEACKRWILRTWSTTTVNLQTFTRSKEYSANKGIISFKRSQQFHQLLLKEARTSTWFLR